MGFKFRLEVLLRERKAEEEVAKKDFAEARSQLDQCMREIQEIYGDVDQARILAGQEQVKGGPLADLLQFVDQYIFGQKIKAERKRLEARGLMANVEEKQERLVDAAREHKKIEKIKERQQVKHNEREKKRLERQVDDMNTMRFKRSS